MISVAGEVVLLSDDAEIVSAGKRHFDLGLKDTNLEFGPAPEVWRVTGIAFTHNGQRLAKPLPKTAVVYLGQRLVVDISVDVFVV